MKNGYFITFEGADGCGKTTQLNLLKGYLISSGYEVLTTREPGATPLGIKLREILLHYDGHVADIAELFLYLADRAQHVETEILPALKENKIILCDRYTDSTLAYQCFARGINPEQTELLNNIATSYKKPDLTFVFDVESEIAQKRLGSEKDRLEQEGLDFHKKVRAGYLEIAKKEPERVRVIDANRQIEAVFEDVKKIFEDFIK